MDLFPSNLILRWDKYDVFLFKLKFIEQIVLCSFSPNRNMVEVNMARDLGLEPPLGHVPV